jgi:hypothetical protein
MPKQKSKLSIKKRKSNINKSASYRKKKTTNKTKRSRKLTKKLSRHKKRVRKQNKNIKLIDGGGCGGSCTGSSNTFKSYMTDLKSSLNMNDKLKGGGYYKDVLSPGIGNKAEVKWHED